MKIMMRRLVAGACAWARMRPGADHVGIAFADNGRVPPRPGFLQRRETRPADDATNDAVEVDASGDTRTRPLPGRQEDAGAVEKSVPLSSVVSSSRGVLSAASGLFWNATTAIQPQKGFLQRAEQSSLSRVRTMKMKQETECESFSRGI